MFITLFRRGVELRLWKEIERHRTLNGTSSSADIVSTSSEGLIQHMNNHINNNYID